MMFIIIIIKTLFFVGLAVADFKDLKPIHNHICTGTYDYGNGTITSDPVPVKIDCGKLVIYLSIRSYKKAS